MAASRSIDPNAIGSLVPPFGGSNGGSGGSSGGAAGSVFQWNAAGLTAGYFANAVDFDGMASSNAALAGDGPFDGQRVVDIGVSIANLVVSQRVPSGTPGSTRVAFYRIRAGTVLRLGDVTLPNTAQFELVTAGPTDAALLADDILFVSLEVIAAGVGEADISCYLELTP